MRKQQKNIYYAATIIVLFFLSFIFFIFIPQGKQIASKKQALADSTAKIAAIVEGDISRNRLATVYRELTSARDQSMRAFAINEEALINACTRLAAKLMVHIQRLSFSGRHSGVYSNNNLVLDEVTITFDLTADFGNIVAFLDSLNRQFPFLVQVHSMQLRLRDREKALVNATATVSAIVVKNRF